MPTYLERYVAGECAQVWEELYALGPDVRQPPYLDDAVAVARETMRRVRSNCEILIPRLETLGWRFGYEWAEAWVASEPDHNRAYLEREIAAAPPLIGNPTPTAILDNIETNNWLLPISLRAFYEVVGAINFVGAPFERPDWPRIEEGLDPLYLAGVQQSFGHERVVPDPDDEEFTTVVATGDAWVTLFPDWLMLGPTYLGKYFIDTEWVFFDVPATGADVSISSAFDDRIGCLGEWTLVSYLRCAMRGGGFFTFLPGAEWETRPEDDLAYLTRGLWPI